MPHRTEYLSTVTTSPWGTDHGGRCRCTLCPTTADADRADWWCGKDWQHWPDWVVRLADCLWSDWASYDWTGRTDRPCTNWLHRTNWPSRVYRLSAVWGHRYHILRSTAYRF